MSKALKVKLQPSPTTDNVEKSVLELRRIYHEKTDAQFIAWYADRYKVPYNRVKSILERSNKA
jgi:hypothetical protein